MMLRLPSRMILASASPRRRELLSSLGVEVVVVPSAYPEPALQASPSQVAFIHAIEKAADVAPHYPHEVVLAADTVVDLDGEALGKPRDAADARRMLARLQGRRHVVHTAFALVRHGQYHAEISSTSVTMYALGGDEIALYVATGDPLDKAGSYGIQGLGATLVEKIEGDYYTVVGLPLAKVYRALLSAPG